MTDLPGAIRKAHLYDPIFAVHAIVRYDPATDIEYPVFMEIAVRTALIGVADGEPATPGLASLRKGRQCGIVFGIIVNEVGLRSAIAVLGSYEYRIGLRSVA